MSDIFRDFDKKNEFPKVKLNLPKFDFSHLTEAVTNMNTAFDNIAKDIREQQDNAMAMEFTKCIGELLKKNGVVPKLTEYTRNFETDKTFETRYGVTIDDLDFSEHDKVFEDKIAELSKKLNHIWEIGEVHQNIRIDVEDENKELKQRIAELESENEQIKHGIDKMATSKSEWIDRAVEWQQKCEKLESKETKNCENEPKISDSTPSMEWYDNRHQSDCIEINRLNTTIDVLIHKVEYLRQFAGLE